MGTKIFIIFSYHSFNICGICNHAFSFIPDIDHFCFFYSWSILLGSYPFLFIFFKDQFGSLKFLHFKIFSIILCLTFLFLSVLLLILHLISFLFLASLCRVIDYWFFAARNLAMPWPDIPSGCDPNFYPQALFSGNVGENHSLCFWPWLSSSNLLCLLGKKGVSESL